TTTNLTRTAPLSGQTPVIQTLSSSGSFTADNFETNAWGFSLDGTNFEAISLSRQINQTIKEANSSSTDIYFGAKLNNQIPSGDYASIITFIATTNPLEANFDTAFDAAGKTQVSYNGQNYYKMQDMSGFICSMVATPTDTTSAESTQLIDTRDNKIYWVSKLKDGNCWMTQNLDLDLNSSVALTNDTTDLNSVTSWTPTRSTIDSTSYGNITTCSSESDSGTGCWGLTNTGFTSTSGNNLWDNDNNTPYSVNPGYRYMTFTDRTSANPAWYSNGDTFTNCSTQDTNCGGQGHYMIGNYYNFAAANATNSVESTVGHTVTDSDANFVMPNSICPKGWRMPIDQTTNNEFNTLLAAYNITDTGALEFNYQGLNAIRRAPLYFVRSGGVDDGTLNDAGVDSRVWSSTISAASYGHYLYFDGINIFPARSNNRLRGFAVRCLARTDQTIEDATYLQDVTPEMRQNTAIGTTTTVLDKRDNNEYTIGKLEDGNIWLLDNLRLGGDTEITLTPSDTNVATNFTLPASSTTCFDDSANCDGSGDSSHTGYTVAAINSSNREIADTNGLKYGNYYNFCAASAGTICQQVANSNATYDICPANWRLPTLFNNGSYYELHLAMDLNNTEMINKMRLNLPGAMLNGNLTRKDNYGNYWESTKNEMYTNHSLTIDASGIMNPEDANWRYFGQSVRCVLK
ncbi:hypothetical protein IJ117_00415, partial [Candidatus Saccharibacteria bacterium]|nr:hypothetical protein [Candidatus Saccharibacteria bacterium]